MLNYIVVPIDFSEISDNASRYAMNLAKKKGGKVLFTHAIPMSVTTPVEDYHPLNDRDRSPEKVYPILEKDMEVKLKKYALNQRKEVEDVETFMSLQRGTINDALEELAKNEPVDLVVMGTQGSSGIDTVVGTNTARAIRNTDIPVLAVPAKATYKNVQRILYAEDLKDDEFESASQVQKFAEALDAELIIFHVYKEDENDIDSKSADFQQKFDPHFTYQKKRFEKMKHDDVGEAIEEAAKEFNADVIAMQTRERGFISKFFKSSLTKKICYHTDTPLLALNM